ncbi:MAG TPA: hypothetical protein DCE42_15710 [Myxococcales bacterium]|nr:hypothetical protein [Deltaproteobacteria bacterium]MBU47380.1 hypothetical protein [Deltaproteobacteria bacterium]HAA56210.1 hypothetical protein [Myxococcales bacterium]|tara:strand:- start:16092 stop:16478 length:387 start_codon:yes stop_codon:yes gene_type:complete
MTFTFPRDNKPVAINGVAIGFVLLVVVLVFLIFSFVPPWYKSLNVKEKVGEYVSGYTHNGFDSERFSESLAKELEKMGVDVNPSDIEIEVTKDRFITIVFSYEDIVRYPFVKRITRLKYHIKVKRKLS